MNGTDLSKRYPRIVEEASRVKVSAVMNAEVVCLVKKGIADFDMLHGRTADHLAVACAFDLLMHDGDDLRRQPLRERKLALSKLLMRSRGGIQYVEHTEGHAKNCLRPCAIWDWKASSPSASHQFIGRDRQERG